MAKDTGLNLLVRAWLLVPLCMIALASIAWKVSQRWQVLHGTEALAEVYQKLGKEGSGSSGRYYFIARYQTPQANAFYARVETDRSTHDELLLGTPVRICYAGSNHQNTLLTSEWSYSGKLLVATGAILVVLLNGLDAQHTWRRRRRNGYLRN